MLRLTVPKPDIQLGGITYNKALSEETNTYAATLWVAGEKWGTISNAGHGGPDNFNPTPGSDRNWQDVAFLDKVIANTFPTYAMDGVEYPQTLEIICGDLIDDWLTMRELSGKMHKAVVFLHEGGVWSLPLKGRKPADVAAIAATRHPGAQILNLMPKDEALAAFKGAA